MFLKTINSAKDGPKPVTTNEEGLFCFAFSAVFHLKLIHLLYYKHTVHRYELIFAFTFYVLSGLVKLKNPHDAYKMTRISSHLNHGRNYLLTSHEHTAKLKLTSHSCRCPNRC